jgi:hypothetical protein
MLCCQAHKEMVVRTLIRCGAVSLLVLIAGCGTASDLANECRWNRSSCMYEGTYDPGERDYAEEEAARLNRAELRRIRRGSR